MKKITILLLAFMAILPVSAQIRGYNIRVTVTPDHKDWNYKVGETVSFTVNVLKSGTLLDHVKVDYEAGPVMYPDVKKKDVTLQDGTMKWSGKMTTPGFYRLKVTAHVGGKDMTDSVRHLFHPRRYNRQLNVRKISMSSGIMPSRMPVTLHWNRPGNCCPNVVRKMSTYIRSVIRTSVGEVVLMVSCVYLSNRVSILLC